MLSLLLVFVLLLTVSLVFVILGAVVVCDCGVTMDELFLIFNKLVDKMFEFFWFKALFVKFNFVLLRGGDEDDELDDGLVW